MKRFFASVCLLVILTSNALGGPSETFDKGITASDQTPSWYAAREFNVQLWGAYAFRFINDFSWNVLNGRDNNFGMAHSGINLAF